MSATDTPLTPAQRDVLRHLVEYQAEHGRPPSFREAAAHFGWSGASAVTPHVKILARKGYLERGRRGARSLRVVGARYRLEYEDSPAGRRLREALEGDCHGEVLPDTRFDHAPRGGAQADAAAADEEAAGPADDGGAAPGAGGAGLRADEHV